MGGLVTDNQNDSGYLGNESADTWSGTDTGAKKGGTDWGSLISTASSLTQLLSGLLQKKKANTIADQNPRPTASVMESLNRMVSEAHGLSLSQDIPGGDMYRNEIKGATASGIRAATQMGKGSEAFGALGAMVGQEQNSFANMAKTTAQQVSGYKSDYIKSLMDKAGAEQGVWNFNVGNKYLQAAQTASQLNNSGSQNLFSGISNLSGIFAEKNKPDFYSSLNKSGYGNNNGSFNMSDDQFNQWYDNYTKGNSSNSNSTDNSSEEIPSD